MTPSTVIFLSCYCSHKKITLSSTSLTQSKFSVFIRYDFRVLDSPVTRNSSYKNGHKIPVRTARSTFNDSTDDLLGSRRPTLYVRMLGIAAKHAIQNPPRPFSAKGISCGGRLLVLVHGKNNKPPLFSRAMCLFQEVKERLWMKYSSRAFGDNIDNQNSKNWYLNNIRPSAERYFVCKNR